MPNQVNPLERWNWQKSRELYNVQEWSGGYFDVDESGDMVVCPHGRGGGSAINLFSVIGGLKDRGLDIPVLLRFSDILDSRISALHNAFQGVMKDAGYEGAYRGVYPIKVNQQQQVVEEVTGFGRRYHHGLEVGSKAELIAALAYLDDPEALLVCNGYKDEEFVELALLGLKMGLSPILVLEMPGELQRVLSCADRLGVAPRLGIRVKLSSQAGGKWTESGGDRSVFGLTTEQIVDVLDQLREAGRLDCLQMLHYHLGSQIPNIRDIRTALQEACRFYVDLVREGAPLGILDVGGGLAVDYDGSQTNFPSSRNYTLEEYCADIVEAVMAATDAAEIPHPTIVSESGRATVAHHSVLLFNILDAAKMVPVDPLPKLAEDADETVRNLFDVVQSITAKNAQECYHDATYYRDEVRSRFAHGSISLRERALADRLFWHAVAKIVRAVRRQSYVPDELQDLDRALADVYYGNFSVFQSLPDSWAIGQLFPVMPIHRLNEAPARHGILADITCDCDGKIDRFTDLHDVRHALPLHELRKGEDYYLGVFLVGAYQETLGDLHNLLGDTNVVSISMDEDGQIRIAREIEGDSVADVLSYVEYDPKELVNRVKRRAERAVQEERLTPRERRAVMDAYESGLRGYTYFEE
jgi:arginine decarboxylase